MGGNAEELYQDRCGPYDAGDQVDPKGPESGNKVVGRGGDWYHFHGNGQQTEIILLMMVACFSWDSVLSERVNS
jgi:hypothetical protein